MVTFNKGASYTKFQAWNKKYEILPIIIVKISHNSRRDSGWRLCLSRVRHFVNPKCVDIKISNIEVADILSKNIKKKKPCFGHAKFQSQWRKFFIT